MKKKPCAMCGKETDHKRVTRTQIRNGWRETYKMWRCEVCGNNREIAVTNKIFNMKTLLFLIFIFAGLWACNPPADNAPVAPAQAEGEPMGAAAEPTYFVGYHLVIASGAIKTTGAAWVPTKAWVPVPVGTRPVPGLLMADLIKALTANGSLAGIDLKQTAKNHLIITATSAPLRDWMIYDSRAIYAAPAQN